MQTQSSRESVIVNLLYTIHVYVSLSVGWSVFQDWIYPMTYFAKGVGPDLSAHLPIYFLNVMAFGCLVYVGTRPFAMLIAAAVERIENMFMQRCHK